MARRTFGWVQNPNRLDTLKNVVALFLHDSKFNRYMMYEKLPIIFKNKLISYELYSDFIGELSKERIKISYDKLKGKGSGGKLRKDALCTGIVQAAINAQGNKKLLNMQGKVVEIKKPYTDDWTADGYLRWAISTGLIEYEVVTDSCYITPLGVELVKSEDGSDEERVAFTKALLAYPPVVRVLQILDSGEVLTKFEIGNKLGFKGEMGFTSIPQNMFVAEFNELPAQKRSDYRANVEGDSDKYARTIANWLVQMGWVVSQKKNVSEVCYGTKYSMQMQGYRITTAGKWALKTSNGYSSNPKVPKIVLFEMLATKVPDAEYIRLRRGNILKQLDSEKTLDLIHRNLKEIGIDENIETIKDDISNLTNIGINIQEKDNKYKATDIITKLVIPNTMAVKENITSLKDSVRERLKNIDHKYLVLIDLAYSNASTRALKGADARDFEIQTAELLTNELRFKGERLGEASRPDIIISYDSNGTIIDNKSYQDGFSVDRHAADEMARYIEENQQRIPGVPTNEWWKKFNSDVTEFSFLFITSFLKGNFVNNIKYISTMRNVNGAAIGIDNLLYLAEDIKSGKITYTDFFKMFQNEEIVVRQ